MADPVRDGERLQNLLRYCSVSRQARRAICEDLNAWRMRGTDQGPRARWNKLLSHIDRVGSYLYAPDTARFGVHLPVGLRDKWLPAAGVARDEFRQVWRDSGADIMPVTLIEWALTYGATIAKVQADPYSGFTVGYINPYDFGVSQEDIPSLDKQHTFAHWYTMSLPQIEWWLLASAPMISDRRREDLLALAKEHSTSNFGGTGRQGLVLTQITGVFPGGTIQGGFPGDPDTMADTLAPIVDEPVVEFVDIWERKRFRRRPTFGLRPEVFEDYLVTTLVASSEQVFAQRRNPDLPWTRTSHDTVLPAEHPFVVIAPHPQEGYFWGRSEIGELRKLQEWLSEHLEDMKMAMKKQIEPANFFSGIPDPEEAGRAMNTPGGYASAPEPGARMDSIKVELTPQAFQMLKEIEGMFGDASGIPESLTEPGNTPGGVRSTGQFSMVAGIGAGRIRRMALVVEDGLGHLATKGFRTMQRHDTQPYPMPGGGQFLLSQLPAGLTLRVDAHSAAPIFQEQTQAKAGLLYKAGAIGGEDLVELIDPPGRDELKVKAKARDEAKAEFAKEKLAIEQEKARAKTLKAK